MTSVSDEFQRFGVDPHSPAPESVDVAESGTLHTDAGPPSAPWWTVWTAPRETIRRIVDYNLGLGPLGPGLSVLALLAVNGIGQSLGRAAQRNAGDEMPASALTVAVLVGGTLGGVFGGWLLSHLLRISGWWIGGTSDRRGLLTALAWASVPTVAATALWIPQLAVAGMDLFTSATPRIDASPLAAIVLIVCGVVGGVLGTWSFVLMCNTVAEVQGYRSAWAGFGNLLLAGVLLAAIAVAIGVLAYGLMMLASP